MPRASIPHRSTTPEYAPNASRIVRANFTHNPVKVAYERCPVYHTLCIPPQCAPFTFPQLPAQIPIPSLIESPPISHSRRRFFPPHCLCTFYYHSDYTHSLFPQNYRICQRPAHNHPPSAFVGHCRRSPHKWIFYVAFKSCPVGFGPDGRVFAIGRR